MNWAREGWRCLSKITNHCPIIVSRRFGNEVDHQFTRDFFVKLWVADRKVRRKPRPKHKTKRADAEPRWFSASSDHVMGKSKRVFKQPPISQSVSDFLDPESPQEAKVAPLLARSNLLITRDIEWANLVLGFEQENRYAMVDVCYPQSPVGFIREKSSIIARQLLRLRRPFVAYITDAMGKELFRVRRPFWWITSSIYAEIDGNWSSSQAMASLEENL